MRRLALPGMQLAVVIVAVGCWELVTRSAANPNFPTPSSIVSTMYHQWFDGPVSHLWLTGNATGNLLPSLGRILAGLAVAGLAGIAAGLIIGRNAVLAELTEPLIHFGRAIPPPTLVPAFLFIFKIGSPMEIGVIAFGVLWPVLLNTIDGARHVHPGHLETARAFRLGPGQRLTRVILPAAAPKIFAGLRLGLSISLILMVISEFEGSTDGIGRELLIAQGELDVPTMWAVIVLLGLLGIAANALLAVGERRALAWQGGPAGSG
ncbi:MAG TPA: ABC transporter permease [Trebonia sp.]|nr:ABC transporter permease [Trebonia sp.]